MKALAYAFSAENPHALRNILLVAVTIAYLVVIVVLFLRLRHANQKWRPDERTQQTKTSRTGCQRSRNCCTGRTAYEQITYLPSTHRRNTY